MIHKNIYSNRMKKTDEVDPYVYSFKDNRIQNSFIMLINKIDEYDLCKALVDFCETKRIYISNSLKDYILSNDSYGKFLAIDDITTLLSNYSTEDILDFFDILIAIYNNYLIEYKDSIIDVRKITYIKNCLIKDLNDTFEHNNLGYYVVNDVITTKESDFLHQEVISKPLTLLVNEEFNGAAEEFTKAIDNYTKRDYENCILEACKAFESTIKSIMDNRQIEYETTGPNAKLNKYIEALKTEGLFDSYLDSYFSNLNAILNSSVNTIRNRLSGHGDGKDINEVERSYASFVLNLSGSCIVFLLDRYYELGGKK